MSNPTHKIAFYPAGKHINAGDVVAIVLMMPKDGKEEPFDAVVPATTRSDGIALNGSHKFGDIVEVAEYVPKDTRPEYERMVLERLGLPPHLSDSNLTLKG